MRVLADFALVVGVVAAFIASLHAMSRLMVWAWEPHPYLRRVVAAVAVFVLADRILTRGEHRSGELG